MQLFFQYIGINNDALLGPQYFGIKDSALPQYMESDIPDWYNILDIDLSLLDQFDNNNIIELELKDQINKNPLPYWDYISDIELNLLDQFDDNSIVELKLRDQKSKYPLK